jgi:multidrug transporter EmrE-like cation transporter
MILFAAIAVSMGGQVLLKSGAQAATIFDQIFAWHTIIGLTLYGCAAMLYIFALRKIPLSVAMPATAISYIVAALVGHYGYGEPFGTQHIGGMVLIISGVLVLAFA